MPLTCDFDDYYRADEYAEPDLDFSQMPLDTTGLCSSCQKELAPGDIALKHTCWRYPTDEEVDQYYDEDQEGGYDEEAQVPLPDKYLCERCGEIRMNLEALEYAICIEDDMQSLLHEYQQMTGFDPAKYQ